VKDLFSAQADLYSMYRPTYPSELFEHIFHFLRRRQTALDCATGNGQVARTLAPRFEQVFAVDISERQLEHAVKADNVRYSVSRAEETPFANDNFDLITVAQAYHWIDGARFCREARRIARKDAVVAVWGYDLAYSNSPVDTIIRHWNFDVLSPYWEAERKHIYNHYRDLPFDFEPLPVHDFEIVVDWTLDQLVGHLRTWSALQKMIRQTGDGAFRRTVDEITKAWGADGMKRLVFPLFLKLGRVNK
jgi:ubiquinone/menaquinone biosynthesis C-methylase UbiE